MPSDAGLPGSAEDGALDGSGEFVALFDSIREHGKAALVMPHYALGKGPRSLEAMEKSAAEDGRLLAMLHDWHRVDSLEAGCLLFDETAAWWGARTFARAAWIYLDRTSDEALAAQMLAGEMPHADSAAAHFSADLALRWLPDLHALVRAASPEDPFLDQLRLLARRAPLSGVGIPWLREGDESMGKVDGLDVLRSDPGVWRVFVDRIIQRRDREKLADAAVAESVKVALGAFPSELASGLLQTERSQT